MISIFHVDPRRSATTRNSRRDLTEPASFTLYPSKFRKRDCGGRFEEQRELGVSGASVTRRSNTWRLLQVEPQRTVIGVEIRRTGRIVALWGIEYPGPGLCVPGE